MAGRPWGFLCPDDGGQLLEITGSDKLYCPNAGHVGRPATHPLGWAAPTPAFFDRAQVKEGYAERMANDKPSGTGLTDKQLKAMKVASKADPESDKVAEAAVNKKAAAKAPAKPKAAKAPAKPKAPKECLCGCGEMTKGGTFRPGHDAKYHAALKAKDEPGAKKGTTAHA